MTKKNKVTIYDISEKLKISAATVSRALNDSNRVSPKTKDLVLKTAKEMNYQQNTLAQALKSGKTYTVGVVVPYINHSFFASVIRGMEEELAPRGYHVVICQTHDNGDNEAKQIKTLLKAHVDGIFVSLSKNSSDLSHLNRIIDRGVPLIFFDRKVDLAGVSSVTIDDAKGGYLATEHLIKEGYSRIVYLTGDENLEIYRLRLEGYKKALEAYRIPFDEQLVVKVSSKISSGMEVAKRLLAENIKFDAIFSSSDYAAFGALQELQSKNVKIPAEVAVVGFSNEPFTQYLQKPLSSVHQTPVLMGKMTAKVFLDQISDKDAATTERKIVLEPELKIRSTSSKAKSQDKVHFDPLQEEEH